ncbi:M28 family metallopeptidase [Salmonirosea aquatica]|uniref:M28 family peptidase n=1 Tax=Salmonirosea aquatica TaxID=2654236 RepID=A0A7C9BJ42_9BACT|nr:M28 family peptidase [Cytophagaceae bacterium SJW1-29]
MKKLLHLGSALLFLANTVFAQKTIPPALNSIRTEDLKKDLYALADAHFRGRSAGTLDELKAAMWLGEQYRSIGLKPAGDDGTYFQYFTLWRNHLDDRSSIAINGKALTLWDEVAVSQMANSMLDAPIVYLGNATEVNLDAVDVAGKVVAMEANPEGINSNISLPTWRYGRSIFAKYGLPLVRKGAAAIIFVADETAEKAWADAVENYKLGSYDIDGGPNEHVTTTVPVMWLHAEAKEKLRQNNATLQANLLIKKYPYPSVNILGVVEGTDSRLKSEYLLYSGHTDAHGVRNEIKNDSIYYGADDNGSVDVALLANARAFVKNPGKRSVIFAIHGAEERGLLGSRYFTAHPTVPLAQVVAVLNGDMIGRNTPDSAAVLGVIPPHRTSLELVNMALEANREGPNFKLDTEWDKATHKEGWYFRSDHLPYARLGIPSLMYTTLLHPDYHTPQDNAENIDYPKLKKMTDWMYRTGWKVANTDQRPASEKDFKLER